MIWTQGHCAHHNTIYSWVFKISKFEVYVLQSTDIQHSFDARDSIGVYMYNINSILFEVGSRQYYFKISRKIYQWISNKSLNVILYKKDTVVEFDI